ncbi:MAG: hypothetical protein RL701_1286, partial [Pseudomonadota bacterium]
MLRVRRATSQRTGAADRMTTGRNIALSLARHIAVAVVRLASIVLVARVLGPEANGQYALAVLVPTLLTATLNLGIPAASVYFVASGSLTLTAAWRLNLRMWSVLVLSGGVVLALVAFVSERILPGLSLLSLGAAGLLFPITLASALMAGLTQARRDFAGFNRALLVAPLLSLALIVLGWAVLQSGLTVFHVIVMQVVAELVGALCFWALLRPQVAPEITPVPRSEGAIGMRALLKFAGMVHLGNIVMQVSYRVDLYLVNLYLGAAAAGTYYVGVRIAEQVWLASQPVATVLLPEFAANYRQKSPSTNAQITAELMVRLALYASVVLGAVLCLIVRPAVGILFGDAYRDASELVFWLLPGVLIFNASRIASVAMTARGEPELN